MSGIADFINNWKTLGPKRFIKSGQGADPSTLEKADLRERPCPPEVGQKSGVLSVIEATVLAGEQKRKLHRLVEDNSILGNAEIVVKLDN